MRGGMEGRIKLHYVHVYMYIHAINISCASQQVLLTELVIMVTIHTQASLVHGVSRMEI